MPFVEVNENYRPLLLYPKSRQDAQKLEELKARPFIVLTDSIEDQVAELIKINNPSETFSTEELADRVKARSEEHTSELQSRENLVCRLLLEKKKSQTQE